MCHYIINFNDTSHEYYAKDSLENALHVWMFLFDDFAYH